MKHTLVVLAVLVVLTSCASKNEVKSAVELNEVASAIERFQDSVGNRDAFFEQTIFAHLTPEERELGTISIPSADSVLGLGSAAELKEELLKESELRLWQDPDLRLTYVKHAKCIGDNYVIVAVKIKHPELESENHPFYFLLVEKRAGRYYYFPNIDDSASTLVARNCLNTYLTLSSQQIGEPMLIV